MRLAAFLWLAVVIVAGGYLFVRIDSGLNFQTDLMALLPREEHNPTLQRVNDTVVSALSHQVMILVGHKDRTQARAAATEITKQLLSSNVLETTDSGFDKDRMRQMGKLYYPYRSGLLAEDDRRSLQEGGGQGIATRALAQVYGVAGFANAKLLQGDPFLLMPHFFMGLPLPLSHLSLDDGMLSLQDNGTTWVLIAGHLKGEPFALNVQKSLSDVFDNSVTSQQQIHPGLEVLHLGAVFFAKAGAEQAMHETSIIGITSTLGTILLVVLMFRAIRPLLLSLLVIGIGVMMALAVSLWIFGELHVGALLFGVSLIGVAVDYSLQYCTEIFAPKPGTPHQRLKRVFMGITLGTATTLIGYLTFLLAPFPSLHQIAIFSAVGLLAAWITVVLWLPFLDTMRTARRGQSMLKTAGKFIAFWEAPKYHRLRVSIFGVMALVGVLGLLCVHTDDDVHHLQSLSAKLVTEQEHIQKLIGNTNGSQFFLVQAPDDETALQREEQLTERLHKLVDSGALAGFQSLSQYVPSSARQMENRALLRKNLYKPLLVAQASELHLADVPPMPDEHTPVLTLDAVKSGGPLPFLSLLRLNNTNDEVMHVVMLDGVTNLDALRVAANGLPGVRLVDPSSDFSALLGKYRARAIMLLVLSAVLMAPLLMGRYGVGKGLRIMLPPSLAVIIAPALRALAGGSFTFFDAMALVLILSIGVDYAVFCAETSGDRKPVTMLAVVMAACTALMSFGLLALSGVMAVHNFGATMSIGILFAFLFAPMVRMGIKLPGLRNTLPVLLILILCNCTNQTPDNTSNVVHISPELTLTLPQPGDLGRPVEVTQLVTAHYGDQNLVFEAHIDASADRFFFVGLDLMGRKAISIDWTADGIVYDAASWVPPQLQPQKILADMVLLYWPEAVVRQALQASSGKLLIGQNSRTIMIGKKEIMHSDYHPAPGGDLWSGPVRYQNLAWKYDLAIQSSEQDP